MVICDNFVRNFRDLLVWLFGFGFVLLFGSCVYAFGFATVFIFNCMVVFLFVIF